MNKNWQVRANEFTQKRNLQRPTSVYALDVISEMGEVAKEILLATDYGARQPQFGPDLEAELGDLLYSVCMLASSSGVDLESAFSMSLDKYNRRWQATANLGSQEPNSPSRKTRK